MWLPRLSPAPGLGHEEGHIGLHQRSGKATVHGEPAVHELVACPLAGVDSVAAARIGAVLRSTDPFKPANSVSDALRGSARRAFLIDGAGIIAAGSLAGGLLTSGRTWTRAADLTEPAPSQVDALCVYGSCFTCTTSFRHRGETRSSSGAGSGCSPSVT